MLASSLLLLLFLSLIVWGFVSLLRTLLDDSPHAAPESPGVDERSRTDDKKYGATSRNS